MTIASFDEFAARLQSAGATGLSLDWSRIPGLAEALPALRPKLDAALTSMRELEAGAIANPDENRMVGHYWLRAPERAPSADITQEIQTTVARIHQFANDIHAGRIAPPEAPGWKNVLLIGIGWLRSRATTRPRRARHRPRSSSPLLLRQHRPRRHGSALRVDSGRGRGIGGHSGCRHFQIGWYEGDAERAGGGGACVAAGRARHDSAGGGGHRRGERARQAGAGGEVAGDLSDVGLGGGRTSVLSAVGLLPAALQGLPIDRLLEGARLMDEATRVADPLANPASLLAAAWHHEGGGRGARDMVILPYRDRLLLMSRYLQQLVMESIGKEKDLAGNVVHQGLAVYGNKGSTDQHAYVQQLRDGLHNFFVTFLQVDLDRHGDAALVETDTTSGDFLLGFISARGAPCTRTGGGRSRSGCRMCRRFRWGR
jgi:glucose-6-phosphate isomerase